MNVEVRDLFAEIGRLNMENKVLREQFVGLQAQLTAIIIAQSKHGEEQGDASSTAATAGLNPAPLTNGDEGSTPSIVPASPLEPVRVPNRRQRRAKAG